MAERFWRYVDKKGPDECWPWTRSLDRDGYGQAQMDGGYPMRATHQALMVHGVEIPPGAHVLHRCHNPPCCNPAHLYIGNNVQNMRDMVASGRSLYGARHPAAKLRPIDVRNIRFLFEATRHMNQKDNRKFTSSRLGRMYGLNNTTINSIVRGNAWGRM